MASALGLGNKFRKVRTDRGGTIKLAKNDIGDVEAGTVISYDAGSNTAKVKLDNGNTVTVNMIGVATAGGPASFPLIYTDADGYKYEVSINNTGPNRTITTEVSNGAFRSMFASQLTTDGTAWTFHSADSYPGHVAINTEASQYGSSLVFFEIGNVTFALVAYAGNPNGHIGGNKGDLCVDPVTPAVWQATGASFTWTAL